MGRKFGVDEEDFGRLDDVVSIVGLRREGDIKGEGSSLRSNAPVPLALSTFLTELSGCNLVLYLLNVVLIFWNGGVYRKRGSVQLGPWAGIYLGAGGQTAGIEVDKTQSLRIGVWEKWTANFPTFVRDFAGK
jgi:hypothetical protein